MEGKVTLNRKEQRRVGVLVEVEKGLITGRQAAGMMDVSLRQMRRLIAAYRKEGIAALAHGNHDRKPYNAIEDSLRQQVVSLASSNENPKGRVPRACTWVNVKLKYIRGFQSCLTHL